MLAHAISVGHVLAALPSEAADHDFCAISSDRHFAQPKREGYNGCGHRDSNPDGLIKREGGATTITDDYPAALRLLRIPIPPCPVQNSLSYFYPFKAQRRCLPDDLGRTRDLPQLADETIQIELPHARPLLPLLQR